MKDRDEKFVREGESLRRDFRLWIDEVEALGLDEYLYGDGVCVVEWADKAPGAFPPEHLFIRLEALDENTRRIRLAADDERHRWLIEVATAAVS